MSETSNEKSISCTVTDGLARLVLTQPDRGNPFDVPFCTRLRQISVDLAARGDVRAILISADGRFFSVGGDINMFLPDRSALPGIVRRTTAELNAAITCLQRMDAPLVCAVHGPAAGGAVGLVAMADFVVAGPGARFTAAFPMIGFSADSGTTLSLPARMGYVRAKHFLMLSETMSAEEAAEAGLVDILTGADTLAAEAEALAQRLAQGPTLAYGGIKRTLMTSRLQALEAALENEAQDIVRLSESDDSWEGMNAFAARRKPVFTGR